MISLPHATANDGDWAELIPETVSALKSYLRTGQFVVLTTEEHPEALVRAVTDAFKPERTEDTSDGYFLELGHFGGIPAVPFSDDVISICFAAADEHRLLKRITLPILRRGKEFRLWPQLESARLSRYSAGEAPHRRPLRKPWPPLRVIANSRASGVLAPSMYG